MYEPFVVRGDTPLATVATVATLAETPLPQVATVATVAEVSETAETAAPTLPRVIAEPPFGGLHPRYGPAFEALCAECPPGADPFAWWVAAFDAASMLSFWGMELARFGWTSTDLFAAPDGLVWSLCGDPVVAIGSRRAFTQGGRMFKRVPGELHPAS
jgi:hypothetical protein